MHQQLKQAGFAHVLTFLNEYKDSTLRSLFDEIFATQSKCSHVFVQSLLKQAELYFPDLQTADLKKALTSYFDRTSTLLCANHAGFENHPMLIASTLLSSVYCADKGLNVTPYCCCASLNPSNSTAPTSVFTGERHKNSLKRTLFRFTPASADKKVLYTIKNFSKQSFLNIQKRINELDDKHTATTLSYILKRCQGLEGNDFAPTDSLIYTLHRFNTLNYKDYVKNCADINPVFINQEALITDLLIKDLDDENSFISQLLLSKERLKKLLHRLSDRANTWSYMLCDVNTQTRYCAFDRCRGTILFYVLKNDSLKPLKLIENNGDLFLADTEHTFRLESETVKHNLKEGIFVPNLFISYCSLYFTHKVRTVGGIFMTEYLKDMIDISASVMNLKLYDSFFKSSVISACLMPFIQKTAADQKRPLLLIDMVRAQSDSEFMQRVLDMKVSDFTDFTLQEMLYDFCPSTINELLTKL